MSAAVVVTGAGVVGACGLGLEPLAAALAAGDPCTSAVEALPGLPRRRGTAAGGHDGEPGRAARVEADLGAWLAAREARRMSRPSRFAVAAARMALADAGLPAAAAGGVPDPALAVVLATAYGASAVTQQLLDQIYGEGPEAASPFQFMESVANAPAGQVAIHCAAGGPNHTLCQREAGPVAALGRAAAEVMAGRAGRAVAGAVEETTPLLHAVLTRFGALAPRSRPFDRRRDGVLLAEGATVLVVEDEVAARRRGAPVRARLRAWGGAFDATAPANGWGVGAAALAAAVRRGLERAALGPGDVDAVVSGASGARAGDRLEAAVLRALWPDGPPPVLAPKAVTGEYAGTFLAAALLALDGAAVAVDRGFEPDPELGLVPAAAPLPARPRRLLVTALAAGGSAAWVILEAPA